MTRTSTGRGFSAVCVGLSALLGITTTVVAQGGGAVIYENGSPDMGSSYAGAGARAQDAATVFSNPAGMTRLHENELTLGVMSVISDFELDLNGSTTSIPPGSTDGGGREIAFAPGLGSFLMLSLTEDLKFGISVSALAANGVNYDPDWVGRGYVTKNFFTVANLQPSLAYRLTDWLSIGSGLNLAYGRLDQELKGSSAPNAPTVQIDQADDWQVGGTFGLLLEPSEHTRIGLTYRTEISFNLEGHVESPLPGDVALDTDFDLPQGVNLSLFQDLSERFSLLADVGWSDWSTFDRQPIRVGPTAAVIDRGFQDTYRAGIGMEFRANEAWKFRSGFSFDSSPVDDDERLPDLPVGDQYRFSVGVQKDFGQGKVFGASYTFFYTDMELDQVLLPDGTILDGDYEHAYVHFVGLTLSVTFGEPMKVQVDPQEPVPLPEPENSSGA